MHHLKTLLFYPFCKTLRNIYTFPPPTAIAPRANCLSASPQNSFSPQPSQAPATRPFPQITPSPLPFPLWTGRARVKNTQTLSSPIFPSDPPWRPRTHSPRSSTAYSQPPPLSQFPQTGPSPTPHAAVPATRFTTNFPSPPAVNSIPTLEMQSIPRSTLMMTTPRPTFRQTPAKTPRWASIPPRTYSPLVPIPVMTFLPCFRPNLATRLLSSENRPRSQRPQLHP